MASFFDRRAHAGVVTLLLFAVVAAASTTLAIQVNTFDDEERVVFATRSHAGRIAPGWAYVGPASGDEKVRFTLALRQNNLQKLDEVFNEVSDPNSPNYGKHLSHAELASIVSLSQDEVDTVTAWLQKTAGIGHSDVMVYMDAIRVTSTVHQAQLLFAPNGAAEFHHFVHHDERAAAEDRAPVDVVSLVGQLSLPAHMYGVLVDHVFGLSELEDLSHTPVLHTYKPPTASRDADTVNTMDIKDRESSDQRDVARMVENSDGVLTPSPAVIPEVIRDYYGIPDNTTCTNNGSIASVGAFSQWYSSYALDAFSQLFDEEITVSHQVGGDCPLDNYTSYCSQSQTEADLDVQYLGAVGNGVDLWFWETSNTSNAYPNGNMPWIMSWALEVNNQKGGIGEVPLIHSLSYGFPELFQCTVNLTDCGSFVHSYNNSIYINRTNTELQKMGVRGWTVLVSSGDDGSPAYTENCPVPDAADGTVTNLIYASSDSVSFFPVSASSPFPSTSIEECDKQLTKFFDNLEKNNNVTSNGCILEIENPLLALNPYTQQLTSPPVMASNCTAKQFGSIDIGKGCSVLGYSSTMWNAELGPAFMPDFPTSSPFVLSVGASQFQCPAGSTTTFGTTCSNVSEVVCSTATAAIITSGSGFADYSAQPSWQSSVVASYLKSSDGLPPSSVYSAGGRAYPDIVMNGHNYIIAMGGFPDFQMTPVDGTSCSAPALAGMLALVNDARLNNDKTPLGFVNPLVYKIGQADPDAFYDIVDGDTSCRSMGKACCAFGFPARSGWDAASGWGSPVFEKFLSYLS